MGKPYTKSLQIPPARDIPSLHCVPFQAQQISNLCWQKSFEGQGKNQLWSHPQKGLSLCRQGSLTILSQWQKCRNCNIHLSFPGFTQQKQAEHAMESKRSPPSQQTSKSCSVLEETPSLSTWLDWVLQHWKAALPAQSSWVKQPQKWWLLKAGVTPAEDWHIWFTSKAVSQSMLLSSQHKGCPGAGAWRGRVGWLVLNFTAKCNMLQELPFLVNPKKKDLFLLSKCNTCLHYS